MGDTWIPDRAIGLAEVLHAFMLLEEDWERFGSDWNMKLQALMAMVFVGGFLGALQGEELPKMELGAIRKYWDEAVHHPSTPHVPMVLSGRFKTTEGERLFFLPLACRSSSGIEIRSWMQRLLDAYSALGVHSGPVFRVAHKGKKVR